MLPCAWPTCPAGVADASLNLTRPDAVPGELARVEEPLIVQRRLLVLEEAERLFIWHPVGP
jgi:hypothetical protein